MAGSNIDFELASAHESGCALTVPEIGMILLHLSRRRNWNGAGACRDRDVGRPAHPIPAHIFGDLSGAAVMPPDRAGWPGYKPGNPK